jgi:hypothetical protein
MEEWNVGMMTLLTDPVKEVMISSPLFHHSIVPLGRVRRLAASSSSIG